MSTTEFQGQGSLPHLRGFLFPSCLCVPTRLYTLSARDINVLEPPLLLDEVPGELQADDGVDQRVVLDSLRESASDAHAYSMKYEDMPVKRVLLSTLRKLYRKKLAKSAFDLLRCRTEIDIDAKYQHDSTSPDLIFDISRHFLDFMLVLSKDIGFHAFLPNSPSDHLFNFSLDLHQPQRILKTKHTNLGFSLLQRALFIGTSRGRETAWLIMVPNSFMAAQDDGIPSNAGDSKDDGDGEEPPLSHQRVATNMQGKHYFMLVMFFAFVYQKYLPGRNIACYKEYPDLSVNAWKNVQAATNIL